MAKKFKNTKVGGAINKALGKIKSLPVQTASVNKATSSKSSGFIGPVKPNQTLAPVYQGPSINKYTGKSTYGGQTLAPNMSMPSSPSGYGLNGQALSKTGQVVSPISNKKTNSSSSNKGNVLGASIAGYDSFSDVQSALGISSRQSSPSSFSDGGSNLSSNTQTSPTSNVINSLTLGGQNTKLNFGEQAVGDYSTDIPGLAVDPREQLAEERKQTEDDYLSNLLKDFKEKDTASEIDAKLRRELQIEQKQNLVSDLTGQLNTIVNKGQANQLSLIGQGRGIPEAIIGGQQAQIGRETAIAALPVQAQLEAAQGNLEMANESLDRLFKIYSEEAQNEFDFKREMKTKVYEFATAEQKRKLDVLDKQEERNYQETKDLNEERLAYSKMAFANGQSVLGSRIAKLDYKSPTFRDDLANLSSQIVDQERNLRIAKLQQDLTNTGELNINPKVLNTTQFKNAQAAVNLKNTLQKAKEAVQKYGNYEKANATGRGLLNSLKVQLRSEISTALEQGVVVPGEAAAFDQIAGQLNKSIFIRDKVTLSSLDNLINSMDSRVGVQKAALSNTYNVTPDQIDTLLNITDLSDQEFMDMDALIE